MSDSPFPSDVYLDTGIVVAAINVGSLNSVAGAAFCEQLIAERCQIYFSQILRLELTEAVRKMATMPGRTSNDLRRQFQLDDWERNPFVRQRWMQFAIQQFEALLARFTEAFELPFNQTIWLASVDVMVLNQLRSHDAIHVATARENRVRCIATTDEHFTRLRDFDVRLIGDATS